MYNTIMYTNVIVICCTDYLLCQTISQYLVDTLAAFNSAACCFKPRHIFTYTCTYTYSFGRWGGVLLAARQIMVSVVSSC